ncbi:putative conjugal transfer protein [Pectobacterium atrosepticum SCRI1043]|uniref:Conjugal transfer protein n=1 Tax=Pectobacterium atrosepticum (strain SCRI 1043 / ATCC BAA-672) TaxID=218491 RepID=Q6D6Q8_PECAS|nr:lytic transglycosylase domain-containing protein [Pectobacterium atrosepticum]MCL6316339.1 transglycosylase [Pectobacterium atrosepticum]MCL6319425.1 transglycosylase [Pectobacterium atrosepticum]CAG74527.1 putative conjugal transfer protein [Pectobacterium atrosepticum SCRI1043]
MLSTSAFLAAAMQCAASVHPATALDIARVESDLNPYAIAEILPESKGVISHHPATLAGAISVTRRLEANGRRYSVGLMQITSTNFRHYGVTARDLFNSCINLSVFERILTDCYRRGGSLKRALSCYYSGNFDTGQQSEPAFNQTSYVQRIGYVVPSTREDKQSYSPGQTKPEIHYPATVLRGDIPVNAASTPLPLRYPNAVIRGALPVSVTQEEK